MTATGHETNEKPPENGFSRRLSLRVVRVRGLQLIGVGVRKDTDLEVAVADAEFVDEFFLFRWVLHDDPIGELEHTAHTGRFDADEFVFFEIVLYLLVEKQSL